MSRAPELDLGLERIEEKRVGKTSRRTDFFTRIMNHGYCIKRRKFCVGLFCFCFFFLYIRFELLGLRFFIIFKCKIFVLSLFITSC